MLPSQAQLAGQIAGCRSHDGGNAAATTAYGGWILAGPRMRRGAEAYLASPAHTQGPLEIVGPPELEAWKLLMPVVVWILDKLNLSWYHSIR